MLLYLVSYSVLFSDCLLEPSTDSIHIVQNSSNSVSIEWIQNLDTGGVLIHGDFQHCLVIIIKENLPREKWFGEL